VGQHAVAELLDRGERGAGQQLALQDREPSLDLMSRTSACSGRSRAEGARAIRRSSVRAQVVQDDLQPRLGIGRDHIIHEVEELLPAPLLCVPGFDLAGRLLEGGEQGRGAVALIRLLAIKPAARPSVPGLRAQPADRAQNGRAKGSPSSASSQASASFGGFEHDAYPQQLPLVRAKPALRLRTLLRRQSNLDCIRKHPDVQSWPSQRR
jgi:hypothetical protein